MPIHLPPQKLPASVFIFVVVLLLVVVVLAPANLGE